MTRASVLLPIFTFGLCYTPLKADTTVNVSPEGPLKSLVEARNAIREKRNAGGTGPAVILVKEGRYEQQQALVLEPQDSDLTIKAEGAEKPLFAGGNVVTGFIPHEGNVVKVDITTLPPIGGPYKQVLVNGERATLARYPNFDPKDPLYGGWAFVDEIPEEKKEGHDWKGGIFVKPQDIRKWAHPEDVELNVFAFYGWWNFVLPVASLDPSSRKLTLAKACAYDMHPHNRYIFQNALEELDAPGEWYIDSRTKTLYLWPTTPLEKAEVRVVTTDSLVKIQPGTRNVRLERLSFTACIANAVSLNKTENCLVAGCTFTTVGGFHGNAIGIMGGSHNVARSNDITGAGNNGIVITGGDRLTLTGCNNNAINNHIQQIGVLSKNGCGVLCDGVGILVAHNHIHDGPRMGVQMSGNNIIVEYNHLHHLVMETQDGGAIYTGGRDWISSRGSVWRYNRIHDIVGCGQSPEGLKHPWFTFGLYPDDNTGGVDMIGNLIYRIAYTPIHMHNSRDCVVENNVFAQGEKFQFDLHGWTERMSFWKDHQPTMIKGYESVQGQPAWKEMRNMELHPRDAFRDDGTMMSGNIVKRNIMYSDSANAQYGDVRNATPKWNTIDENLAWNGSHPVNTGITKVGPDKGAPFLTENFDAAEAGKKVKGWDFNHLPNPQVQLIVSDGALRVDCALSEDPKNTHTVFHGPDFAMRPGAAYRVRLRVRSTAPESRLTLAIASFKAGEGYWQSDTAAVTAKPEWQEVEVAGRVPAEANSKWKPFMSQGWFRVDCNDGVGQVFVDDVRITEAEPLDEWQSWQTAGWDRNGIVADPLFQDVSKDDYRLKPESPAITKLGFKPLPIEKMGLIKDEWRTE